MPLEEPDFERFHVLVVDDEQDARALIQRILERCNVRVTTAGSAEEALGLVRSERPGLDLERYRDAGGGMGMGCCGGCARCRTRRG